MLLAELPLNQLWNGQYARVAVDDGGGVHVVWVTDTATDPDSVWTVRYRVCERDCYDQRSWLSSAVRLRQFEAGSDGSICPFFHPTLVVWGTGANRRVAIAVEDGGEVNSIRVLQFRNGAWEPWFRSFSEASGSGRRHYTPVLAVGKNGRLHIIWRQEGVGNGLRYRSIGEGEADWSPSLVLAPNGGDSAVDLTQPIEQGAFVNAYALTVNVQGGVHVAWPQQRAGSTTQDLYYKYCSSDCATQGNWQTALKLSDTPAFGDNPTIMREMAHDIRLAAAPDGRIAAVWRQVRGSNEVGIVGMMRSKTGVWQRPLIIARTSYNATPGYVAGQDIRNPDVGWSAAGIVHVSWTRKDWSATTDYYALCAFDSDCDGLTDDIELQITSAQYNFSPIPITSVTLNPFNPDTDGDGLLDSWEVDPQWPGAGFNLNRDHKIEAKRDDVLGPYRDGNGGEADKARRLPTPFTDLVCPLILSRRTSI